jgi:uncharacterized membrane protein
MTDLESGPSAADLARDARYRSRAAARAPEARAPEEPTRFMRTSWGRGLFVSVIVLAVLTAGGLIALWPHDRARGPSQALGGPTTGAVVTRVWRTMCPGPTPQRCRRIDIRVDDGHRARLDLGPENVSPVAAAGDRIRVRPTNAVGTSRADAYAFAGPDRRGAILGLAVAFAVLVVVLTRVRGLLALAGFALSLLLLTQFLVPAMLGGHPALLVALVGALAVMFITVVLTYGFTPQSAAAILGIAASLLFAVTLGTISVHAAQLDGRSGELSIVLSQVGGGISLQGVVLGGLVLGALGVLADMAVTQASAVMAVRRANPRLRTRALFREGYAVGRDHLVATTHTLVLAYAGATLPLLLVLHAVGVNSVDALNAQDITEPVVATLVGAISLLISVPLTTGLAAVVVVRIPATALPGGGHHHGH